MKVALAGNNNPYNSEYAFVKRSFVGVPQYKKHPETDKSLFTSLKPGYVENSKD